jgi:hypothetical protein
MGQQNGIFVCLLALLQAAVTPVGGEMSGKLHSQMYDVISLTVEGAALILVTRTVYS